MHSGALQRHDDAGEGVWRVLPRGAGEALRAAELPGVDRGAALRGAGAGDERGGERGAAVPLRGHPGPGDEGDARADALLPAGGERPAERRGDAGGGAGGRAAVLPDLPDLRSGGGANRA